MKKVKYVGERELIVIELGKLVKKGDVIDVPNEFANALFEEVKKEKIKEVND